MKYVFALFLSATVALPAQDAPVFELSCAGPKSPASGVLTGARAVLDPYGELVVTGRDSEGAEHVLRLTFPVELELPAAGEQEVAKRVDALQVFACGYEETLLGKVKVERFDWERIRLSGRLAPGESVADAVSFTIDVRPEPAVAAVAGARPTPAFDPADDEPDGDDLVFCALGGQGTGWPGQHRVAAAVGRLADVGPLDFVLLLGDNFLPRGVNGLADEAFQTAFEGVYRREDFSIIPFHAVLGHRDKLGDTQAILNYARNVDRFDMPNAMYRFRVKSHGQRIDFVAIDAELLGGRLSLPEVRMATRMLNRMLEESDGEWKVVFTHQPMYGHGEGVAKMNDANRSRLESAFARHGVDLYVAGGEHHLELVGEKAGVTHVISGGGGGPEVSRPARWADDTVFAYTGGGFVWFRHDGSSFEISFRDADGKVLYVHRLRKREGR